MRRCSKCIMPETAKGIEFDENGLCQLCKNYKEFIPKGEKALRKEIERYLNKKTDYNCIVPVSGGRDSSYALYFAKELLGLRPLAVHNDNDFETEIATMNLGTITNRLSVPLIRTSSKNHFSKKVIIEKFKMNSSFGAGLVAEQTCEACKYGYESGTYNTARKKSIELIIWGDSKDESTEAYYKLTQVKEIPTKLQRLIHPNVVNIFKYKYYFNLMKREYGQNSPGGLKEIHLYDYIRWDQKVIVDTIREKLGWSVPEGSRTWRVDCHLIPLVNYLIGKAYGVSKIELGYSNMIRGGKMERDDALRQVEQIKENTDVGKLKIFLKEMDISQSIIDRVL